MGALVVYGDFASPLSRVASGCVDALLRRGTPVEWRAVHVASRLPVRTRKRLVGIAPVRRGAGPTVTLPAPDGDGRCTTAPARSGPVRARTSPAIAALATVEGRDAHALRGALFRACWVEGRDLDDRRVVEEIAGRTVAAIPTRARHWQRAWEGFTDPVVPLVLLPTGYVLRGPRAISTLVARLRGGQPAQQRSPAWNR
jgi:hypothetical protein